MIVWSPAPLSASSVMSVWRLSCQRPFTPAFARTLVQTVLRVVTWRVGSVGCGDPLRRRCFYLVVEHPNAEREAAIVARRTPHVGTATHRFIAGLARSLRAYTLEKPPSISEMNDVAMAMELLGIDRILPEHKEIMLPLIAKTEGDRKRLLMKEAFESIVRMAAKYAEQIPQDSPGEDVKVLAGSEMGE